VSAAVGFAGAVVAVATTGLAVVAAMNDAVLVGLAGGAADWQAARNDTIETSRQRHATRRTGFTLTPTGGGRAPGQRGARLDSQAMPSRSASSRLGSVGSARSTAWACAWLAKSGQL
jgi:hypothetical protein